MRKLDILKKRLKSTTVLLCKTLEKPVKQIYFSRLYGENKIRCSVTNYMAYSSLPEDHGFANLQACSKQA